jgi:hypothetical protein
MPRDISAVRAHIGINWTSCKRQVSGSNPGTGSQFRSGSTPSEHLRGTRKVLQQQLRAAQFAGYEITWAQRTLPSTL